MNDLLKISTSDLIPLNAFEGDFPVVMEVIYSDPQNPDNHFENLYHAGTKIIWAHKDLAEIVLVASKICKNLYGWTLEVNDCLRTVEAQEKMAKFGYHPSLVMPPGIGGHPRAMAIDLRPLDESTGELVEMGTPFDYFSDDPENDNPAARDYTGFDLPVQAVEAIIQNRNRLEFSMRMAATVVGREIVPLRPEWWDFRFSRELFNQYSPLSEVDLQPYQRLITPDLDGVEKILTGQCPDIVQRGIDDLRQKTQKSLENLKF